MWQLLVQIRHRTADAEIAVDAHQRSGETVPSADLVDERLDTSCGTVAPARDKEASSLSALAFRANAPGTLRVSPMKTEILARRIPSIRSVSGSMI